MHMIHHNVSYPLRNHRKTWGLSQKDLAGLLGFETAAQISRIEQGKRTPGLETALAYTALFGVSLPELFPQLAVEIEDKLKERAARLQQGSPHTTNRSRLRKGRLLSHALMSAYSSN